MSAKCSSCGAEIMWAKTETGKNMPLSVKSKEIRFWINDVGQAVAMTVFLSHFADCPNAAQHRKPK